ncbi:MAG: ankyrin repeat domain-containing protein [Armatimonas sp.]
MDPNLRDNGDPILHIAIRNSRFLIVKRLLEQGADPHLSDSHGQSALQVAQEMQNPDIVNLLTPYL